LNNSTGRLLLRGDEVLALAVQQPYAPWYNLSFSLMETNLIHVDA
jgi:hypothetical protein